MVRGQLGGPRVVRGATGAVAAQHAQVGPNGLRAVATADPGSSRSAVGEGRSRPRVRSTWRPRRRPHRARPPGSTARARAARSAPRLCGQSVCSYRVGLGVHRRDSPAGAGTGRGARGGARARACRTPSVATPGPIARRACWDAGQVAVVVLRAARPACTSRIRENARRPRRVGKMPARADCSAGSPHAAATRRPARRPSCGCSPRSRLRAGPPAPPPPVRAARLASEQVEPRPHEPQRAGPRQPLQHGPTPAPGTLRRAGAAR